MRRRRTKANIGLHPVMTLLILCFVVILISGILSLFNVQATFNQISAKTGEYQATTEAITSLLSLSGLKYIFTNTVANFANFTVLSHLIIILLGIGIMQKSGFLKTVIIMLTKKSKKTTVTFALVLICMLSSIMGDLPYLIFIPIGALLFLYGKRNPMTGIITAFAALSCGTGLNIFLTSIDSSLITTTLLNAHKLQPSYVISPFSFIFVMLIVNIILSLLITNVTCNITAKRMPKYEFDEEDVEDDLVITKAKRRGLYLAGVAGLIYLLIFIYNIIPGLPFSGNLLDNSQTLYIDKLFSYDSFFSNGFVFIVTVFFVILGLGYGIGAKTIRNNKEFIDALGYSLNGVGKTLLMIFAAATFISIFKYTNIGNVIAGTFTNIIGTSSFSGLPLLFLLFFSSIIVTIFLPSSISKWPIIASTAVPALMSVGISPEFTQLVFRFGESVSMGLTPIFAYFIVYLAYLEKYNQDTKPLRLNQAIKYQLPYALTSMMVFIVIIIIWYIIGLPLGVGAGVAL